MAADSNIAKHAGHEHDSQFVILLQQLHDVTRPSPAIAGRCHALSSEL